jgi:hypothetical protein
MSEFIERLGERHYRIRGGAPGCPGDWIEERTVRIGDRVFEFTRIRWSSGEVTILASHRDRIPFLCWGFNVGYELVER